MRSPTIIIIFILLSHYNLMAEEITRTWQVTETSTLQIQGTSNVNTFECALFYLDGSDLISERRDPVNGKWEMSGSVHVRVAQFDCSNRIMNNDFRKTLNYPDYPEIKIEFINLRETHTTGNNRKAEGIVEISLAGSSRKYHLKSDLIFLDDHSSILSGVQVFHFSDFDLEPPQKSFGLIRVNDEISVSFNFVLSQYRPFDFAQEPVL